MKTLVTVMSIALAEIVYLGGSGGPDSVVTHFQAVSAIALAVLSYAFCALVDFAADRFAAR